MTPGSTRAQRFSTSISRIWLSPDKSSKARPAVGIIPPEQLDAPPRGTIATSCSEASRMIAAISARPWGRSSRPATPPTPQ